jgi:transposase
VFYRSFDNRKQLASYVGLTRAHFQGGAMSRDQGISKAGNAKARTVMIELAWLWLRHQPDSPLSVWFRERVGKLKGRIRRITIVRRLDRSDIATCCGRNGRGSGSSTSVTPARIRPPLLNHR